MAGRRGLVVHETTMAWGKREESEGSGKEENDTWTPCVSEDGGGAKEGEDGVIYCGP